MNAILKTISKEGIPEALSKAERYRLLNEPGEAESISVRRRCVNHRQPIRALGDGGAGLSLRQHLRHLEAEIV